MPRTIWTKLQSEPNGSWNRHEGDPPFSILAAPGLAHDVLTDAGESFVITPLEVATTSMLSVTRNGPDSILVTSSEAGTLYYGFYPDGTAVGSISAAAMIAGNDTNQISHGAAGVFVAAGVLDDVQISSSGLTGGTDYTLAFAIDIEDGGTYTNISAVDYTKSVLTLPFITAAATNPAGDQIILTLNESVTGTEAAANWAVNGVTGGSATVDAVTISGSTITLDLSGALVKLGDVPTFDYGQGDIQNASGNLMESTVGQSVDNEVSEPTLAVTFTDEKTTTNIGAGDHVFSAMNIGTPAADRDVYVVVQSFGAAVASVTVGGVTDSSPITSGASGSSIAVGRVRVSSGITEDVTVNFAFNTASKDARVSIYSVTGLTSEVDIWTEGNNAAPLNNDFDVANGDTILIGHGVRGNVTPVITATGYVEHSAPLDVDTGDRAVSGMAENLAANATYSVATGTASGASIVAIQLR